MERVIIRVDRDSRGCDYAGACIAFLDSGPDCNPGRIIFWDEGSGHGEGLHIYLANRATRPATDSEAAAILADYLSRYPQELTRAGELVNCTAAGYRILKRLPANYTPGN